MTDGPGRGDGDGDDPGAGSAAGDGEDSAAGSAAGDGEDSAAGSVTDGEDRRPLAALADREGWRVEGSAARVHYRGEGDRYSVEYYEPSDCVVYWKVPPEEAGETAVPVGRDTVPAPLRERIRMDLEAAGVDPAVERRSL